MKKALFMLTLVAGIFAGCGGGSDGGGDNVIEYPDPATSTNANKTLD